MSYFGKTNVVLVGMPGAGKSTIGVLLAKNLSLDFFDVDVHIQRREVSAQLPNWELLKICRLWRCNSPVGDPNAAIASMRC